MTNSEWNKNSVQFPRLLHEINAEADGNLRDRLCENMDITEDELDQLFYRAEQEYTKLFS